MDTLRSPVRGYADALVTAGRWGRPDEINPLLGGHKLRRGDLFGYTSAVKTG